MIVAEIKKSRPDARAEILSISGAEKLRPFLVSVPSANDGWLFAGSNGGLAAGRVSPDRSMFPYRTADQILENRKGGGLWAAIFADGNDRPWLPYSEEELAPYVTRRLTKHPTGGSLTYEETHHTLGLVFSWEIGFGRSWGLIRRARIENISRMPRAARILEGWVSIIPPGVTDALYARMSYLCRAYMRHERAARGLAIYSLNVGISDRAEPSESLRYAAAWSPSSHDAMLISMDRVPAYMLRENPTSETEARGMPGAHLLFSRLVLEPGESREWWSALDTWLDHAALVNWRDAANATPESYLRRDLQDGLDDLQNILARVDGWQVSGDPTIPPHHAANALYNAMRGGMPADELRIPDGDLKAYFSRRCPDLLSRPMTSPLLAAKDLPALHRAAAQSGDPDAERLALEYLPLTFGRRHGDPSRPWNRFAIRVRDEQGRPLIGYQGNWRDIFQNWEALAFSYPALLHGMVFTFLNASTADGYNPYRIHREGFDWEELDPHDPWSNIGYWGDHQIVYLTRLLDLHRRIFPGALTAYLSRDLFVFADVPYRIRPIDNLLRDPRKSIHFDRARHDALLARAAREGNDGKLLRDAQGGLIRASLAEKLLIPTLTKLSNHVPGGGIWMNTQRPEWNDANNALAGWGLSVVTAAQLYYHLALLDEIFAAAPNVTLHRAAVEFLSELPVRSTEALVDPRARMNHIVACGRAADAYRRRAYAAEMGAVEEVPTDRIRDVIKSAADALADTLRAARREDGLFHSYNVLHADGDSAEIRHLPLMLEGQVAILASGFLNPEEAAALLRELRHSPLWREDQRSYLLYPATPPKPILERNTMDRPPHPVLEALVKAGHREIAYPDTSGAWHFHPDLRNADDLNDVLQRLAEIPEWSAPLRQARPAILRAWEEVFHHAAFTGRSGGMFGFEGIGCIYWHMVAKLLLAVGEYLRQPAARRSRTAPDLFRAYFDIRDGLGFRKTPEEFGAFPFDPYSHSPAHIGAQQPGMTGQVKEEIIARYGELGVAFENGRLGFRNPILKAAEFESPCGILTLPDGHLFAAPAGAVAFTLMGVPVVMRRGAEPGLTVEFSDDATRQSADRFLDEAESRGLFQRDGRIRAMYVTLTEEELQP
jgi:hypothetical protein